MSTTQTQTNIVDINFIVYITGMDMLKMIDVVATYGYGLNRDDNDSSLCYLNIDKNLSYKRTDLINLIMDFYFQKFLDIGWVKYKKKNILAISSPYMKPTKQQIGEFADMFLSGQVEMK